MVQEEKRPRSFGTHDGTFHADEVTACALLLLFNKIDEALILRSRDLHLLESCEYICDVGGFYDPARKLFDHHQHEYQGPLSSAGMILLHLKDSGALTVKEYDFLNHSLIEGVDAHDNGKDPQIPGLCTYSHVISNLVPIAHESSEEAMNKAFFEAVHFAKGHLERLLARYRYICSCREMVAKTMTENSECLIFDKGMPWLEIFFELDGVNHPALFVIMPSGKHWKLRGIPPTYDERMKVRFPLPLEWAGLLDAELKEVSKIPGAVFCHKGRFISVWETKEDALKALEYTLKHSSSVKGFA